MAKKSKKTKKPDDIVQVLNPKVNRWIKINRTKGTILAHKKTSGPFKNIPQARQSKKTKQIMDQDRSESVTVTVREVPDLPAIPDGNPDKCNAEQRSFVDLVLADPKLNQAQAYLKAGFQCTTIGSAGTLASRLMKNIDVQAYMFKRMQERADRTEVNQDKTLQELAAVGMSDVKDFLRFDVVPDKNGGVIENLSFCDLSTVDTRAIQSIKKKTRGHGIHKETTIEFKLHPKVPALQLMAKHLGMCPETLKIKDYRSNQNSADLSHMDDDQLEKEMAKLNAINS